MDRVFVIILVLLLLLGVPGAILVRQAEVYRARTAGLEDVGYVSGGNDPAREGPRLPVDKP
jgi:hypothetical protein